MALSRSWRYHPLMVRRQPQDTGQKILAMAEGEP
jgi:hypothetical protein